MQFDNLAFLFAIGAYVFIGTAVVFAGMLFYVAFQAVHEQLHYPRHARRISRTAINCRKLGMSVDLALAAARQEADRLGYEFRSSDFVAGFESRFGMDIWQDSSFRHLFKTKLAKFQ